MYFSLFDLPTRKRKEEEGGESDDTENVTYDYWEISCSHLNRAYYRAGFEDAREKRMVHLT